MRLPRRSTSHAPSGPPVFDERLSVPWWWWFPALGVVALVSFEVRLGHPAVPTWLPVALLVPLVVIALRRLGATRVTVTDESDGEQVLHVGPAQLPTRFITATVVVPASDKQAALGPELDPAAYLVHRPWVGPMVRMTLNDPADPTPYWMFSVRRPETLLKRLRTDR